MLDFAPARLPQPRGADLRAVVWAKKCNLVGAGRKSRLSSASGCWSAFVFESGIFGENYVRMSFVVRLGFRQDL